MHLEHAASNQPAGLAVFARSARARSIAAAIALSLPLPQQGWLPQFDSLPADIAMRPADHHLHNDLTCS